MASSMDDLPLILGFTLVAFALGAATPVIVQRLGPEPARRGLEADDAQQIRDAVGALDRSVSDLSRMVNELAADVNRLRTDVAAAQRSTEPPAVPSPAPAPPPPPSTAPHDTPPMAGPDAAGAPHEAQPEPQQPSAPP
jgi:hypothetical protein